MKKLILITITALALIGLYASNSYSTTLAVLTEGEALPKGRHNAAVAFRDDPNTFSALNDFTGIIRVTGDLVIPTGAASGLVLTSSADGTATWQAGGSGADLSANETITGNWVNTAFPWADNEVSDTLTIGSSSVVDDGALSTNVPLKSDFIVNEIPTGAIDGVNTTYTTANTPIATSLAVFLNGLRQRPTTDVSLAGATITFTTAPVTGDNILIDYIK